MTEGENLGRLLEGKNKAEFARVHGIAGGGSMVSQHISGNRPISLEAAIAYAAGLGLPLDAVSPSNAAKAREAAKMLDPTPQATPAMPQLADALPQVLDALRKLPRHQRQAMAADWAALIAAPDSAELASAVLAALTAEPQTDSEKDRDAA